MPDPRRLVQRWLHHCVLALDLCPFAAPVLRDDSLRIAVSDATEFAAQLRDFLAELDLLQTSPEQEISTTLLVFSQGPGEFEASVALASSASDGLGKVAMVTGPLLSRGAVFMGRLLRWRVGSKIYSGSVSSASEYRCYANRG